MTTVPMGDMDVEHLRSWIGSEERSSEVVTEDLAAKLHATLDLPGDVPKARDPAPRLIHHCLSPHIVPTSTLSDDGHPKRGGFLPPVPLPRRMWAGGSIRFHREILVGDMVHRVSRIADVVPKQGRTGLLCFVTVEHSLEVDGKEVISERQDIVYRDIEGGIEGKVSPLPAPTGNRRRRVEPAPTLLFRYSAVTFNAHRIHYDRRYAADVENYPGLVVHGPLQAALLLNYATELRGGIPPDRFQFRSGSPLFDDDSFMLNADENGGVMKLWTAREKGPQAMTAEAGWDAGSAL